MVKIAIHCRGCGKQTAVEITVGKTKPRWARRLWQRALAQGWTRTMDGNHDAFCPDCRVPGTVPREKPLEALLYEWVLECDHCGAQLAHGDEAIIEQHLSRRLRDRAREQHGWRYLSLGGQPYQDLCPHCFPVVTRECRERLIRLVWSQPTRQAAWKLGISDKALEKQCRRLDVPKPPSGFWARWHAAHMGTCRALIPGEVVAVLGREFLDEVFPL